MIKTWQQRCEEHPDHNGIVTNQMIQARMQEEIDDLRAAIKQTKQRKPVAWRKNYQNSGYTYFDERWGTIPNDAEPLFSN